MCVISRLCCPKCHEVADWGFRPCKGVVDCEMDRSDHNKRYFSEPYIRLYCPRFIWPPVDPTSLIPQLCDNCTLIYRPGVPQMLNGPKVQKERINQDGSVTLVSKVTMVRDNWAARLAEEPHRALTLRIPYCRLCREPLLSCQWGTETPDEENLVFGIKEVEMEFSSALWKWAWLTQGKEALSFHLATGYISKPCDTCFNRKASFWQHELPNEGLPNTQPPKWREVREYMEVCWKARTEVEWCQHVDFDPPADCPLPFTLHEDIFTNFSQWNHLAGLRDRVPATIQRPPLRWNVNEECKKFLHERDAEVALNQAADKSGASRVSTTITLLDGRRVNVTVDRQNGKHFGFAHSPLPRLRQSRRRRRSLPQAPPSTRPFKQSRSNGNPNAGTPSGDLGSRPDDIVADNHAIERPYAREPPRKLLKTEHGTFELFNSGFWVLKGVGSDHKLELPLGVGLREELEPIRAYGKQTFFSDDDAYQFPDAPEESDSEDSQPGSDGEMTDANVDSPYVDIGLADDGMNVGDGEPRVKKENEVMMIDDGLPDASTSTNVEGHEPRVDKGKGKAIEEVAIVIDDDSSDEDDISRQGVLRGFVASPPYAGPSNAVPVARRNKRLDFMQLPERNDSQIAGNPTNANNNLDNLNDLYRYLNPQNPTQADRDRFEKLARLYPYLFCDHRTTLLHNDHSPSSRIIEFDGKQIGSVIFFPNLLPVIPGCDKATTIAYILSGAHDRTRLVPWPFLWRILIKFDTAFVGAIELRHMPNPLPPPTNPNGDVPNMPPAERRVTRSSTANARAANKPVIKVAAASPRNGSGSVTPMTALNGLLSQSDGPTKVGYNPATGKMDVFHNNVLVGHIKIDSPTSGLPQGPATPPPPPPAAPAV
ncbi:hypothetical protein F4814DRAFT_452880 [Daldinia grandis]|nr:hypothetical protein F4814DRAFT_452880 [Daldinia grandis]